MTMHAPPDSNRGQRPLRLCLTGGWFSSHNVGDNAILDGICDAFSRYATIETTVLSASPETVRALHGLPAFAPKRAPLAVLRAPMQADAFLFTGGTPFYDDAPHMGYFAALAAAARLARTPVIVYGISLRTLDKFLPRTLTRFIARNSSYLAGREASTVERLQALAGSGTTARLLPDPATQMTPASAEWAHRELHAMGILSHRPVLGVCMRDFTSPAKFRASHYTRGYSHQEVDNLLATVRALCEHVVEVHGMDVAFFPMNTKSPDDDRVPARCVHESLMGSSAQSRVHVVDTQYPARQMKALLGAMKAVVGIRFHSLVLAASMNVPTYAVGYAPKNDAIMQFFERGQWQQTVADLDRRRLLEDIDSMLSEHDAHAEALRRRNNDINAKVDTEMAQILALLDRGER